MTMVPHDATMPRAAVTCALEDHAAAEEGGRRANTTGGRLADEITAHPSSV